MGKLRQIMVDSMRVRGYAAKTIAVYTSCVRRCSYYFMKSPVDLSKSEIERFILSLRDEGKSDSTITIYYVALKYFYSMLDLGEKMPRISLSRRRRLLPEIMSKEEVFRLIESCSSLKYRTVFSIIYSAGLRVSEVANLRVTDIDYIRKVIFIREGKYKKSRYTILAEGVIPLLRNYVSVFRPTDYLFQGKDPTTKISTDCIQRAFHRVIADGNIHKKVHVHTLRHCFATHLLENGTNIFYIMRLLGHSCIQTTMIYLHMEAVSNFNIVSPIDSVLLCERATLDETQGDLFAINA